MRTTIVFEEFTESDLKPAELLQRYLELSEQEVRRLLVDSGTLAETACPGCLSESSTVAFERFGMGYRECDECHSLWASPRPDDVAIRRYYRDSAAERFWHEDLSRLTADKRQEKIVAPRLRWIAESTREYLPGAAHLVDVGTHQEGFAEGLDGDDLFRVKTLIDPLVAIAADGREVIEAPLSEYRPANGVDVVTLLEVVDRTADVEGLIENARRILVDGGLCFVTTILASGFDIQVLWDHAPNIYPPDRMNMLTVEGFKSLFSRHGFELLEFSTPGILDVDIVRRTMEERSIEVPRFVSYLVGERPGVQRQFQEFLQASLLSSYGRLVLRKC